MSRLTLRMCYSAHARRIRAPRLKQEATVSIAATAIVAMAAGNIDAGVTPRVSIV